MAGRLQDAEICAGRGLGRTGLDEMNFKDRAKWNKNALNRDIAPDYDIEPVERRPSVCPILDINLLHSFKTSVFKTHFTCNDSEQA